MTDNWAGFFALFITVLIIYWYLEDRENHLLLALVGVVLGIGLLIRINLLLLFIPIFIFVFFKNQSSIKKRFQRIVILGLSSFLILMPWMLRNYYQIGEFGIEPQKFRMVIETRFNVENENSFEELKSPKPSQMIVPNEVRKYDSLKNDLKNYFDILKFTTAHFLHNEIHSILIFPNSFLAESAKGVIEKNDYIQETWIGEINTRQLISIIINLLIIGTGISISFKKFKWFGLFPLSIHLFYNLSNGLARVSGWRYVIVTDWVVILYYMVGIIFFLNVVFQKIGLIDISLKKLFNTEVDSIDAPKTERNKKILTILSILIVIFIAIGMVLPEVLVEKKYSGEITREEFFSMISISDPDFEMEEINSFLQDPNSVIIHTKAFYPRYYEPGEGEPAGNVEWLLPRDNGNLGFMIINPFVTGVSFMIDAIPEFFPHNSEIYIIGTWKNSEYVGKFLDARIIYFPDNKILLNYQEN